MTPLRKRLSRLFSIEIRQGRPEPIIVTLYPSGTLSFRHPRSRTEFLLDLRSAYLLAARREADRRQAERRNAVRSDDRQRPARRVIRRA